MRKMAIVAVSLAVCAACTTTGTYDARFFAPLPIASEKKLDGRALIQMTAEDGAYVFSGRPTSFVGSAMTVALPLGQMTREASLNVFGTLFRGGAEAKPFGSVPPGYQVVVSPRIERFSHSYGIGDFRPAIAISVSVLDPEGRSLDRRTYEFSGSASTPLPRETQAEYTSRAVQVIIQSLLVRAAADVRARLVEAHEDQ